MQAAIASLFELPLEEVPEFVKLEDSHHHLIQFAYEKGYEFYGTLYNFINSLEKYRTIKNLKKEKYTGIDGYFYACVYSPKYYKYCEEQDNILQVTHAVIIDKNYNIVHDPNPNNINVVYPRADVLGYNGIIDVFLIDKK